MWWVLHKSWGVFVELKSHDDDNDNDDTGCREIRDVILLDFSPLLRFFRLLYGSHFHTFDFMSWNKHGCITVTEPLLLFGLNIHTLTHSHNHSSDRRFSVLRNVYVCTAFISFSAHIMEEGERGFDFEVSFASETYLPHKRCFRTFTKVILTTTKEIRRICIYRK